MNERGPNVCVETLYCVVMGMVLKLDAKQSDLKRQKVDGT